MWVAESYPCQDLVACITVTVWPPELLLRTSLVRVEDERRARCGCGSLAAHLAKSLCLSVVTQYALPQSRISLRVQNTGSFCARMSIWRVTPLETRLVDLY